MAFGCSFAEKAQLKAWLARSGAQARDATIGAYKQVHASYLCYDAPRKYPIKAVRAVCHQLLKEAGLTLRSPKMSDHIQEAYVAIDFAENRTRPWTCMAEIQPNMQLGQIWLPQQHLQLSGQAGAAYKEYLKRREHDKSDCSNVVRRAPEEVLLLLKHLLRPHLRNAFNVVVRNGDSEALANASFEASRRQPRAIATWAAQARFGKH